MLRIAADENFDGRIVRGLFRVVPDLDLVRVQDTPLAESDDDAVLEWAAQESRVVLTHDVSTMTVAA
jgi:predicted nuclease of predicted toxin-antitoxin system